MAFQTPFHEERSLLVNRLHLIHFPMAGHTTDTLADMDAVIKVDKVSDAVDSTPGNRLFLSIAFSHGFQSGATRPDLRMAIHAGFGGRDIGIGRRFYRGMTVTTINSQTADMVGMAELNRLVNCQALIGYITGSNQNSSRHGQA